MSAILEAEAAVRVATAWLHALSDVFNLATKLHIAIVDVAIQLKYDAEEACQQIINTTANEPHLPNDILINARRLVDMIQFANIIRDIMGKNCKKLATASKIAVAQLTDKMEILNRFITRFEESNTV